MGILSTIFGTGDVITKGMDLIDKMHTSDAEMIAAKSKAKTDLMAAYAPFKIAQRILATMFAVTFLSSFVLVLVMALFYDAKIDVVRSVIGEFYIGEIMLTIIVFYFGGGFVEGALGAKGKNKAP
ncbi:hypothetical protein B621_gp24 [Marinomonas phage P12026]|uniref:hypothetical protein n=1 Tax=Marinomonas phage P12026 TaxID=1176423 RepID=UPI0002688F42|nr:hypothetical protein B621_gp24 [Marinomonas phage P12026]AFM54870.1 hypothetical protein P12026_24 [Marinomonas phage P12026]